MSTSEPPESDDGAAPELRSSSSWSSSADVELQRELIAHRLFDGAPVTIDRFVIEGRLGAGASAVVYAARDPLLDRRVAIKLLEPPRDGQLAAATHRLIREARALARLSHRNVVAIYEVGHWQQRPFIAMELIEGTTLAQWLAATPRSTAQILATYLEAGRGLAAAHAVGHVHRDFKPANVLVSQDGRVVVSDFGLVDDMPAGSGLPGPARAPEDTSRPPSGRAVGTPAYAAPEQRQGAAAHPSADVYSFALALLESVLGGHPRPESSASWKPALRALVPTRVYRALCAALQLEVSQRMATLAPLLEALARSQAAPARRRRVATLVGTSLLLALVLALVLAGVVAGRAPRFRPLALAPASPPALPALTDELVRRPAALEDVLVTLLAMPAAARGADWQALARTLLLLPVPTRIPCRWPQPPRTVAILHDQVIALDPGGAVMTCALGNGEVHSILSDVQCLRPVDAIRFGVTLQDGRIVLLERAASGWHQVPFEGAATAPAGAGADGYCRFAVAMSQRGARVFELGSSGPRWEREAHGLRLTLRADRSLWQQRGDAAPQRLVAGQALRFRPDDELRLVVVVTRLRTQLLDLTSGEVVADAPSPSARTEGTVLLLGDGRAALAVWLDGTALWWRRGQRRWQALQPQGNPPRDVSLSPSGERALMWDTLGRLEVRELGSGRRYPLADALIREAQFLDDDRVVAVDSAGAVWSWSLAAQRAWVVADHLDSGRMWGTSICDDLAEVITATNQRGEVVLRSSLHGQPQLAVPTVAGSRIYGLACAQDRILAGSGDGTLFQWARSDGRLLAVHKLGVDAWVWTVAEVQPPDGVGVVLLGVGQEQGANPRAGGRLLALREGVLQTVFVADFGGNTGISELAVSADQRTAAAVASSGQLAVIEVRAASPLVVRGTAAAHVGEARRVRFVDQDRGLITVGDDGILRRWEVNNLDHPRAEINLGHRASYDLDVRGRSALVGSSDGHLGTWDLASSQPILSYRGHSTAVTAVRFDATGRWLASGDHDGQACLHRADLADCYVRLLGHGRGAPIEAVRFVGDGGLITASDDGTARQWQPPYEATATELACELQSHLFVADGRRPLASTACGGPREAE